MYYTSHVRYIIKYLIAEAEKNSIFNIQNSKAMSKGWQSEKNSLYPQEMYLELDKPSHLRFISILCHQSKISSKVSIYINQPGEICLTKLGGFSFNDNKRSNYQAREKKTVKVDCDCEKIKLVFEINYDNEINKFNQIGIIGIDLYGEEISPTIIKVIKLQVEISRLENIKKKAVEDENYDLAKETNNKITKYKEVLQKFKEEKILYDFEIDNIDINNKNEILNNTEDKKSNKNEKMIDEGKTKKDIENNSSSKRIVNKKKNVEKVSTGVSTNEKDNNNRYIKPRTDPFDFDQQKVGNTLTFSQMVEKELSTNSQFSPYHDSNKFQKSPASLSKKEFSNITDEDREFINSIVQFLPEEILYSLVSKNVKEIEKAINSINQDLILYNNNGQYKLFMNGISIYDLVFTCLKVTLQILKKNYIPPKIQIINILNILLNQKFLETLQVIREFEECLITLLDYLGDSNQKLREKVEKLLFEYSKKTKSGNKVINLIISSPIRKNLIKSRNHLNGRYLMVSKIIHFCGYMKNNFENIIKYAINGYAMNKINIRDAALEIISRLYKYEGEKVHQYFQYSGLRPAQIKAIQDKLDEIDSKSNEINNKELQNNNIIDEEHTCEFCGYYKQDLTKDELNIHQYKDCPMLMQCTYCKQIIEISNLNNHLLNECDFKDKFIKCNKCKQVVEKETFNEHQNYENCFDVNEEKEILCPLCHLNIIMDDIWKIHFLENGCQHNIRIVTPSTTNASNL